MYSFAGHPVLLSFPTRRSSDLSSLPPPVLVQHPRDGCRKTIGGMASPGRGAFVISAIDPDRSEEHTSELQSPVHPVCRPLLEKQKFLQIPLRPSFLGCLHLSRR